MKHSERAEPLFDEPRESAIIVALAKLILPAVLLVKYGSSQLSISAESLQRFKNIPTQRVILCPNHSSWDDSDMIFAFSRLLRENFHYLTAWEVFHSRFGCCFWLQHVGCYSIVRGIPDRLSYRTTIDLLAKGKQKIVIFPEGEISHDSQRLLPIRPGIVHMAMSALKKLKRLGGNLPIYILPMVLKYKLEGDLSTILQISLNDLFRAEGLPVDPDMPLYAQVKLIANRLLIRLEAEYQEVPTVDENVNSRIESLRAKIIAHVARELGVELSPGTNSLDVAHTLQSIVYAALYYKNRRTDNLSPSKLRLLAKDLHRVVNFISVYENFVGPSSSYERLAELIDLLETEILHRRSHKGKKTVHIAVGNPINLSDYYEQFLVDKETAENAILSRYRQEMEDMIGSP